MSEALLKQILHAAANLRFLPCARRLYGQTDNDLDATLLNGLGPEKFQRFQKLFEERNKISKEIHDLIESCELKQEQP